MKQVYIVYSTDDYHYYSKRKTIGVYDSKDKAIEAIVQDAQQNQLMKCTHDTQAVTDKIVMQLQEYNQTHLSELNDYQYDIECFNVNQPLL